MKFNQNHAVNIKYKLLKQCPLGLKHLHEDVPKVFYETYKAFKRGS